MANKNEVTDRLRSIMLADRGKCADVVLKVVESDIFRLLNDYMCVRPENLRVNLTPSEQGYLLTVAAVVDRLLDAGSVLPSDN